MSLSSGLKKQDVLKKNKENQLKMRITCIAWSRDQFPQCSDCMMQLTNSITQYGFPVENWPQEAHDISDTEE
jgi:hypothetical protein